MLPQLANLPRAAPDAGLDGAHVVTDDPRVGGWLEMHGVRPASVCYDTSFFNEIRKIKTISEIGLMRVAARVNERAMLLAGEALTDGPHWDEIETVYMTEMARRGTRGVYCICGVGGLPSTDAASRPGGPVGRPSSRCSGPAPATADSSAWPSRRFGAQPGTKPDPVLEPGMVINLDMPYTEIGWGSLHLEDTVLATADGHEPLTTAGLDLRCVPD